MTGIAGFLTAEANRFQFNVVEGEKPARRDLAVSTFADRCLQPVRHTVDRDVSLALRPVSEAAQEEETELDAADFDVDYYEGDTLDLRPILAEQVLLDLPMKLLCSDECAGLCSRCGVNRNIQECDCDPAVDPRLSPLAELRDTL